MSRPVRVGITHGDINGIGYEVIVKALADERFTELCTPVIFGVQKILNQARRQWGGDQFSFKSAPTAADARDGETSIVDIDFDIQLTPGEGTPESGQAAVKALDMAVEALKNGDIDVLVTAPISKHNTHSPEFPFPGHTEYLEARFSESRQTQSETEESETEEKALMVLCDDTMRVALVSTHLAIADVAKAVTKTRITDCITRLERTLRTDFSKERPKIAVLSLNPHNGDNGLLGSEEKEIISPAIEEVREKGMLAFGPFPADGFFAAGKQTRFDGILAMYHDQGLAPFKALAGERGINFTAGLRYVRTSPDHGTAYDIAWKGEADPTSMREAIYAAIDIYRRRQDNLKAAANPLKGHHSNNSNEIS